MTAGIDFDTVELVLDGAFILLLLIAQAGEPSQMTAIMAPVPVLRNAAPLPGTAGETRPISTSPGSSGPVTAATKTETEQAIHTFMRAERIRSLLNALRAFDAGRFQQAEEAVDRLLKSDPWDTTALTISGAARIRLNDLAGARTRFETYIKYHPFDAMGHFYLGLTLHLAGDRKGAIEKYWTALLLDPELQAARANMNLLSTP